MMPNPFERGSTSAILFSTGRLMFWAVVACIRVTSRAVKRAAYFGVGLWIGFTAMRRS